MRYINLCTVDDTLEAKFVKDYFAVTSCSDEPDLLGIIIDIPIPRTVTKA